MSKSQVQVTIDKLMAKGYLTCQQSERSKHVRTGTIEPTAKAWEWRSATRPASAAALAAEHDTRPVRERGATGAGNFRDAGAGDPEESISLPVHKIRGRELSLLRVEGDSMEGDGLRNGDHVIVDPEARWDYGDMVVVYSDGGRTLKRIIRNGSSVELVASNKAYKRIVLQPGWEHLGGPRVEGKVVGLVLWHVEPGSRDQLGQ